MKRALFILLSLSVAVSAMAKGNAVQSESNLLSIEPSPSLSVSAEIMKADAESTEDIVSGLSSLAAYLHCQGEDELSKKITYFINFNRNKFTIAQLQRLKEILSGLDEDAVNYLNMTNFKDPDVSLILSVLTGTLGIDRFYIGDIGLGIGKLLTCGGFGVWWIVDMFLIQDATRDANFATVHEILAVMS